MLPTSGRFLFYELVVAEVVDKAMARGHKGGRGIDQDVADALMRLREVGLIPWSSICDETRDLYMYTGARTVIEGVTALVEGVLLDPWAGPAPLMLTESRSLAGVLRPIADEYRCLVAPCGGQCGGFLRTHIGPAVGVGHPVGYLGDLDKSGADIEGNTRRVVEPYGLASWERLALTDAQVEAYDLPVILKRDRRSDLDYPAVETEALSQRVIVQLVRGWLDAMLPEPLAVVREREKREQDEVSAYLARWTR
jgi:hypothetical protein